MSILSTIRKAAAGLLCGRHDDRRRHARRDRAGIHQGQPARASPSCCTAPSATRASSTAPPPAWNKAAAELPRRGQDHRGRLRPLPSGSRPSPMPPTRGYDVVIAGTFEMIDFVVELAPQYPDIKFITFDDAPDFSATPTATTSSASCTRPRRPAISPATPPPSSRPPACSAPSSAWTSRPSPTSRSASTRAPRRPTRTSRSSTPSPARFNDPAKGKEIALAQLGQGADVIFPIAGGTGIGALQAVKDAGKLAVGVDSDQAAIFAPDRSGPGRRDLHLGRKEGRPVAVPRAQGHHRRHAGVRQARAARPRRRRRRHLQERSGTKSSSRPTSAPRSMRSKPRSAPARSSSTR